MEERSALKHALAVHGHVPNRALGQNFLIDETVVARIVDAADIEGARVVEIGPGLGALTRPLLARAARVIAIEKDARLADILRRAVADPALTVVTGDFLDADLPALTEGLPWCAVGNLPYYATTPIVQKLLTALPDSMTLMVQAEAAERFFASPSARVYGPVAVMSQTLYAPTPVCDVPRNCFHPSPDVDSAVVRLTRRAERSLDTDGFLRFLKSVFAMRRKTLRNNLAPKSGFAQAIESLGLPENVRAEAIEPALLFKLYQMKEAST